MIGVFVYGIIMNLSALSCLLVTIVCYISGIDLL